MNYKKGDIVVVKFPFVRRNGNEVQKGRSEALPAPRAQWNLIFNSIGVQPGSPLGCSTGDL